jgi:uncharacterized membrane protein YraQ (UPF0718 family)
METIGFMWAAAIGLGIVAWFRRRQAFRQGVMFGINQFKSVVIILAIAMLLANFVTALVPEDEVARLLGENAGIKGILLASLIGGFVPGGPMITFPIVVALVKMGVAIPSVIAFLTAWGTYAMHRVIIFELPLIGWRFVVVRWIASLIAPPVSGILAGLLVKLFNDMGW